MHRAAPALLLLALRLACIAFLVLYPVGRFVLRLLWRPWVKASLARGVGYLLEPLALLEAKRLYRDTLEELGPLPAPKGDINAVTFAELCEVEGVGAGRAREILSYRDDYGPFRRMEELGLVKGVGSKLFKVLCERFEVPEERRRTETATHRREALTRSLAALMPPPPSPSPRPLRLSGGERALLLEGYIDVGGVSADEAPAPAPAPAPSAEAGRGGQEG
jgi:competence ComEA-like helix-hairpin-helix protein